MRSIIHQIQQEDPSFDPVELACARARVDRATFKRALSRVVYDGYYGPVSADEWRECHEDGEDLDVDVAAVPDALKLLGKVSECIDDYEEIFFGTDEDGDEFEYTETVVDASDLRRDVFSAVRDIYGHLPF